MAPTVAATSWYSRNVCPPRIDTVLHIHASLRPAKAAAIAFHIRARIELISPSRLHVEAALRRSLRAFQRLGPRERVTAPSGSRLPSSPSLSPYPPSSPCGQQQTFLQQFLRKSTIQIHRGSGAHRIVQDRQLLRKHSVRSGQVRSRTPPETGARFACRNNVRDM
jgi:hypothetical protein